LYRKNLIRFIGFFLDNEKKKEKSHKSELAQEKEKEKEKEKEDTLAKGHNQNGKHTESPTKKRKTELSAL